MRCVSARVFPEPAPASTKTGPWVARTTFCWSGLRFFRASRGIVNQSYWSLVNEAKPFIFPHVVIGGEFKPGHEEGARRSVAGK